MMMNPTQQSTRIRLLLKRLLGVIVVAAVCIALLLLLLQSPPARKIIESRIAASASELMGMPVRIEGITGFVPLDMKIAMVTLDDTKGAWAEFHGVRLKILAAAFLRLSLNIQSMSVEKVVVYRAPVPLEDSGNATWGIAALPQLPAGVRVESLEIKQIEIATREPQQGLTLHATGSYRPSEADPIQVDVEGMEGTQLKATLSGGWTQDAVSLSLKARDETVSHVYIPAAGPLTLEVRLDGPTRQANLGVHAKMGETPVLNLTGTMSPISPLSVSMDGTIQLPKELQTGNLYQAFEEPTAVGFDATLGETGHAKITRFHFANAESGVEAAGSVDLNTLQADISFEGKCAEPFHFIPTLHTAEDTPLLVHGNLKGTKEKLALDARAALSSHEWLSTNIEFIMDQGVAARGSMKLIPAPGALPMPLELLLGPGGDAEFDLGFNEGVLHVNAVQAHLDSATVSAGGTLDWAASKADLTVSTKVSNFAAFGGIAGTTLAGNAAASLHVESNGTQTTVHFDAQGDSVTVGEIRVPKAMLTAETRGGTMSDLLSVPLAIALNASFPGIELQPGLPRDLKLDTALTLEDFRRVDIAHFNAGDGNFMAKASGRADLVSRQGDLSASLQMDDLAAYTKPFGFPYGGKLKMEARVASAKKEGTLELAAKGRLDQLTGLPKAAARLSDTASFDAHGAYDGASMRLDTLDIALSGVTVSGQGAYGIQDRTVSATLKGTAKDLALFETLAGREMAGSATLSAEFSGDLDKLAVHGNVEATSMRVDVVHADTARAEFNLEKSSSGANGTASALLDAKGKALQMSIDFAQSGRVVQVSEFGADAGPNALHAQGQWDLVKNVGSGTLAISFPRLEALHTWIDLPISGSVSMDAHLSDNGAALTGSISAAELVLPGLAIGSAQVEADVKRPFRAPSGDVSILASAAEAGGFAITALTLNANGPAEALRLALQSEGTYENGTPFAVGASGQANATLGQIDVQTLQVQINTYEVSLDTPTSLLAQTGRIILSPARFQLGDGRLELEGTLDQGHVDARAEWTDVSLMLAPLVGSDPLQGNTSGTATLSGTPSEPKVTAEISIAKLRIPSADSNNTPGNDTPGIDTKLSVHIEDHHASAAVSASIPNALHVVGDIRAPMVWTLVPWRISTLGSAPLVGKLSAKGDFSALPELLGLDGHVVRGKLAAELTVEGTVADPIVDGRAHLTEGYYENKASGTILNNLSALLEAKGRNVQLTHFSADDSAKGKINAVGELSMVSARPFSVVAELDGMRLVHRDDLTAEVSGTLSLAGGRSGGNVTGELRVGPATIVLPDRLPAQQMTTVQFRVAGESAPELKTKAVTSLLSFPITLDVHAAIPGNAIVRARGLKSEWEGDLRITGTSQDPVLEGALRVRDGKLTFLGRDFDLRHSTITFNGESPPSPMLNLLAVSEQRNVTARVRLEGELESLNVTLESDPPLPRDDLLSQVLFGRKVSEISPLQGLQLARYAALFDQRVSGTRLFGGGTSSSVLDRFSVDSGTGLKDTTVKAGKNFNDNLYSEFAQGVGTNSTAVSLEWLFAPNWSLRGKTGSNSEGGVGIFWKKDY